MSIDINTALLSRSVCDSCCYRSFETESELGLYCAAMLFSNDDKGILLLGLSSNHRLISKSYISTRFLDRLSDYMSSIEASVLDSKIKYTVVAVHERAVAHYKIKYLASVAREASTMLERRGKHLLRFYAVKGFEYENLI